jgi:hypothetical protein
VKRSPVRWSWGKALISLGMHPHQAQRAQLHFRRLDMRMLRELMPVHTDTVQISRVREARRELEEIFQREMQKESGSWTAGMSLNKGKSYGSA